MCLVLRRAFPRMSGEKMLFFWAENHRTLRGYQRPQAEVEKLLCSCGRIIFLSDFWWPGTSEDDLFFFNRICSCKTGLNLGFYSSLLCGLRWYFSILFFIKCPTKKPFWHAFLIVPLWNFNNARYTVYPFIYYMYSCALYT